LLQALALLMPKGIVAVMQQYFPRTRLQPKPAYSGGLGIMSGPRVLGQLIVDTLEMNAPKFKAVEYGSCFSFARSRVRPFKKRGRTNA
jgi:hypothetical protein